MQKTHPARTSSDDEQARQCLSTSSILQRSKNLRARALQTSALSIRDPRRLQNIILERAELLQINEEMEAFITGVQTQYLGLSTRVFDLATVVTRGPNGHDWKKLLSDNVKPSELFQKLHAVLRFLEDRQT